MLVHSRVGLIQCKMDNYMRCCAKIFIDRTWAADLTNLLLADSSEWLTRAIFVAILFYLKIILIKWNTVKVKWGINGCFQLIPVLFLWIDNNLRGIFLNSEKNWRTTAFNSSSKQNNFLRFFRTETMVNSYFPNLKGMMYWIKTPTWLSVFSLLCLQSCFFTNIFFSMIHSTRINIHSTCICAEKD